MGFRLEERTEMVENNYTVSVATCDSCGREDEVRVLREGYDNMPKKWKSMFGQYLLCPACVGKVIASMLVRP